MYRKFPIRTGNIYHVFNHGISDQFLYNEKRDYKRFCELINFYRFISPSIRFSFYNRLEVNQKVEFMKQLMDEGKVQVLIYAFCLLPNHFHLILKELVDDGIRKFLSNLQNSYARYLNVKEKREGSLFREMFKAIRVETDEQFMHVTRYVHLNPYSNFFVKKTEDLLTYPWSSFQEYLFKEDKFMFIDKKFLLGFFPNIESMRNFTLDQADYQKSLKEIGHLFLE